VYPTKLSGDINLTKGNSQFRAAQNAIEVFPVPAIELINLNYFLPLKELNGVRRRYLSVFI